MKKRYLTILAACTGLVSTAQVSLLKDFNGTTSSTFSYSNAPLGVVQNKAIVQYRKNGRAMIASLQTNGLSELLDSVAYSQDYPYTITALPTLIGNKLVALIGQDEHHVLMTDGTKAGTDVIRFSTYPLNGYTIIGTDIYVSGYDNVQKIDLPSKAVSTVSFSPFTLDNFSALAKISDTEYLFTARDKDDSHVYKVFKYALGTKTTTEVKSLGSTVSSVVQKSGASVGNKFVFIANESGGDGLYVSDGTNGGTVKKASFEDTDYFNFNSAIFNGKYFFSARTKGVTTTNWSTLWCTDGNTATELQAANDNTYLINPYNYTPFNGKLYYLLSGGGIPKLCYTDGTVAGTVKVDLPYDIGQISVSGSLATDADKIYFGGWVINSGKDGVFSYSKTGQLQNYYWGSAVSEFQNISLVNGRTIFQAYTNDNGFEYFILGTPDPTGILDTYTPKGTFLMGPNPAKDNVRIASVGNIHHIELWNQTGLIEATSTTNELATQHLPRGLYLVKVYTEEGKVATQKLILE